MFVTNWISTTKIQKISEITNFFRHYFLSRTEVYIMFRGAKIQKEKGNGQMKWQKIENNPQLSTFFFCIFKK